jgi:small subunit ribosomal protein S18
MLRTVFSSLRSQQRVLARSFYLQAASLAKTIEKSEDKKNNVTIIEGKYLDDASESDKSSFKYEHDSHSACALCKLEKMDIYVQHTDVLILRQFLKDDGTLLPIKVTQLCKKQYDKLRVIARQAHRAGLLMNLQPPYLNGEKRTMDPHKRPEDLKWNRYYDDYEILKKTNKFL